MKAIKNLSGVNLDIDFNGDTYKFDSKPCLVNEDLFAHIQNVYPMAFDFEFKSDKTMLKVKSVKTQVRLHTPNPEDGGINMKAGTLSSPRANFTIDNLTPNGKTDGDGVSWYGETEITGGK